MNAFLEACGATGPLILGVEAAGATGPDSDPRTISLPFALIGRDPRCDLRLDRPEVGDRHAFLQLAGGRLYCIDLGGPGGISLGGKSRRFGRLERDRPVRLGPYRIRLQSGDDVPRPALDDAFPFDAVDDPGGGLPRLDLDLRHRSIRRTRHEVRGALSLVGSADDCQVRLIDPSVSGYHACLVQTAAGVWVVDLLGEGGIRVNDVDVSYARVHEGDEIRVGRSLIVRPAPEPSAKVAKTEARVVPAVPEISAHESSPTLIHPTPVTPAIPPVVTPTETVTPPPPAPRTSTRLLTTAALSQMTMTVMTTTLPASTPTTSQMSTASLPPTPASTPKLSSRPTTTRVPTPTFSERAEDLPAGLTDPIDVIRHQMSRELEQAQLMLAETFTALRDEQWAMLNQEMEQVVRMTQELQALRDDLREQSRTVSEQLKQFSSPKLPALTRLGSAASLLTNGHGDNGHRETVASPRAIAIPTPPRPQGFGNGRPAWASPETAEPAAPRVNGLALREPTNADESEPESVGLHDREAHARLFERIVGGGDDDRRGLWQRLFGS